MTHALKLKCITPYEYLNHELQADIRHEYIHGEIFAMAGASEQHNRIALNVAFQLRVATRGTECGVFISDMKIRIRHGERFYYPDVSMCCDRSDDDIYFKDYPCFIAEVLSHSTAKTDRREKWIAYREIPQLRYYLLINSDKPYVEYFRRTDDAEWEIGQLEPGETLVINCAGYQANLHFADIFEDIIW